MSEHGYRRLLRWAALPVTDRRWAAPLAAAALGFGLFVGVAVGPGTSGTLATGVAPVIEIPGLAATGGDEGADDLEVESQARPEGGGESAAPAPPEASEPGFPLVSAPVEEPVASEAPEAPPVREPEEDAAAEEPITLSGVVVHANPAAGSYAVAEPSGALNAVHAAKLPLPGTRVSVPVRTLANGTVAEDGTRKRTGTAAAAKLEGTVTYVDPDPATPAYAVSKRGVSVLVRVPPDPAGATPVLPVLGAYAKVEVAIEKLPAPGASPEEATPASPQAPPPAPAAPACEGAPAEPPRIPAAVATLWQTAIEASDAPFAYGDFAGVVMAVCASQRLLAISADDLREGGADLLVSVPAKLATADLVPGDSILATAEIAVDGGLTLKGLASDERSKGADDAAATRGDLVNHLAD